MFQKATLLRYICNGLDQARQRVFRYSPETTRREGASAGLTRQANTKPPSIVKPIPFSEL